MIHVFIAMMHDITLHQHQNKSEKILHLFWEFPPIIQGGLGVAGKALCDALSNCTHIDVVCPESSRHRQAHSHPYTVYQVKMPSDNHLSSTYVGSSQDYQSYAVEQINAFSKGVKNAHFTGYHTIHAHDWITADAAKNIQQANQPDHTPIILHIHSTQVDRVGEQTKGAIFKREQQAMQESDIIVTVSDITKETIVEHYDIAEEKITVIRNTIANLKTPSIRPPHPPTILFVARLEAQKSPQFAIEVICAALKKIPKARAIIAGKGTFLETVRDLIKFKKMDTRIEVLGHIPHEKMYMIYQISDVLVLPSASEPFGLVALEAAQSGVAVIMSDRCGAKETLRCAPQLTINTTISFDQWVETTVNLLSNKQLRDQQTSTQHLQLSEYSWDDAARNLLQKLEIRQQMQ